VKKKYEDAVEELEESEPFEADDDGGDDDDGASEGSEDEESASAHPIPSNPTPPPSTVSPEHAVAIANLLTMILQTFVFIRCIYSLFPCSFVKLELSVTFPFSLP